MKRFSEIAAQAAELAAAVSDLCFVSGEARARRGRGDEGIWVIADSEARAFEVWRPWSALVPSRRGERRSTA